MEGVVEGLKELDMEGVVDSVLVTVVDTLGDPDTEALEVTLSVVDTVLHPELVRDRVAVEEGVMDWDTLNDPLPLVVREGVEGKERDPQEEVEGLEDTDFVSMLGEPRPLDVPHLLEDTVRDRETVEQVVELTDTLRLTDTVKDSVFVAQGLELVDAL